MSTELAINTFPRWKNALVLLILLMSVIYAIPNLYGEDPALQIVWNKPIEQEKLPELEKSVQELSKGYTSIEKQENGFLVRFARTDAQLYAKDELAAKYVDDANIALNLAPRTPSYLRFIHADPMKLGLDLRGGVHFLLDIDMESATQKRIEGLTDSLRQSLRTEGIRYNRLSSDEHSQKIVLEVDSKYKDAVLDLLKAQYLDLNVQSQEQNDHIHYDLTLSSVGMRDINNYTVDQTLSTLRNRVNELGVAEALVQRQGGNHVIVELPGVQDTARAKEILGKTATLEFLLEDESASQQKQGQGLPVGTRIAYTKDGFPVALQKRVLLTGNSITNASSGFDRDGRPAVNIRLGGGGLELFKRSTRENIGKRMAVLYIETRPEQHARDGKVISAAKKIETVISLATIQSGLGDQFQITGLAMKEAQDLSLLLRAGALPANVSIVEERVLGPSLGQENIAKGVLSMEAGLALVFLFMFLYYSYFGLIANLGLLANLTMLTAALSFMDATLTLPGIAGIVLTLGMAVDGNVLIFERIREEIRSGTGPQMSIHKGFERAFDTIFDSNITTLIVALILFSIGSGPIRGFAIVISIGIVTTMFTSVTVTRAIVNLFYSRKPKRAIRIGI